MTDRRSEGLTSPLWFSVQFGALLLVGYLPASLIAGVGAVTHRIKEHGIRLSLVPTATVMVAAFAAGLLFDWLRGMPNAFVWVWQAFVVAATVVAYCAITGFLTFVSRSIASHSK